MTVTNAEEWALLRRHRRKPLVEPAAYERFASVECDGDALRRLLPHRDPLRFVDRVTAVSEDRELIVGTRYLAPDDPTFAGHFPDYPLYPGTFQVEAIGQLGLCLWYFRRFPDRIDVGPDARPATVRATRIGGALFNAPAPPDRTATIVAQRLEDDGFRASIIGQFLVDDAVCCTAIGEVVFLDTE